MMSIASWCVLEQVRDNPGSISPYAASSAAGEALAEIEALRAALEQCITWMDQREKMVPHVPRVVDQARAALEVTE